MKNEQVKAKDLPYPYTWSERHPLFQDRVFYVPDYYRAHCKKLFPPFEDHFGNDHPVHIEYCSGNGEWILSQAIQNPHVNWVAVEWWFPRVRKIYAKMMNLKIENLVIVSGEGLTFSREYLLDSSLDRVYVNFPDPWPKGRHAKHRMIQPSFAEQLRRVLKKGGVATFVTDDLPYRKQMEEVMRGWTQVEESFENYGSSFFDRLWRSQGLTIYHLSYVKD